jgi:branched-chain amino acid transport system substrate-binding protein
MSAQFIAKSYAKAGKVDKEKFIDALEGMTLDSPVGPLTMRACDHQVELPMFFGVTKKSTAQESLVAGDVTSVSGKDTMPTCEEIRKVRAGAASRK